jgi:hypothetical protein
MGGEARELEQEMCETQSCLQYVACQCRLTVECDGAVTVTAAPLYFCGLVVLVQQVTGEVKVIEKMGENVEFMAEQRGFIGIPELFRGAGGCAGRRYGAP